MISGRGNSGFQYLITVVLVLMLKISSFGQDTWSWNIEILSGSVEYRVIGGGVQIVSPSTTRPEEIRFANPFLSPIILESPNGEFDSFCYGGLKYEDGVEVQWEVHLEVQQFSDPSPIPPEFCEGETLTLDITNNGLQGHKYSFLTRLNGGSWTFISDRLINTDPKKYFQFVFSETDLMTLFGFSDPKLVYGSYEFKVEVTTCNPDNIVNSHVWGFTELFKRPPVETIKNLGRQCPTEPIKLQVDWKDSALGENVSCTGFTLVSYDGSNCSFPIADQNGNLYCPVEVVYNSNFVIDTQSNEIEFSVEPGIYGFLIEGDGSCLSDPFIFEVTDLPDLSFSYSPHEPTCRGNNDGYIEVQILDGVPPFMYDGKIVGNQFVIGGLIAGEFKDVISDNCSVKDIEADIKDGLILTTSITNQVNPTCNANGSIEVTTKYDGDQDVKFQVIDGEGTTWGPQTSNVFENLPAGDLSASVIINGKCSFDAATVLIPPPDKIIGVDHRGQTCSDEDGFMILFTDETDFDISYLLNGDINLSGWATEMDLIDQQIVIPVPPGDYQLIIENNCSDQTIYDNQFSITPIDYVSVDPVSDAFINCADGNDGQIIIQVNDGTPPYSIIGDYTYTNLGDGVFEIIELGAGDYVLQVEDKCGISASENFSVLVKNNASEIVLDEFDILNQISCSSSSDASVIVNLSGGSPFTEGNKDYQVTLLNDRFDEFLPKEDEGNRNEFYFYNLAPGTYYPIIQDNNGCDKSFEDQGIIVIDPLPLVIEPISPLHFGSDQVKLDQGNNLSIKCEGDLVDFYPEFSGGTGAYSFLLVGGTLGSPQTQSKPYQGLGPGTYSFTIYDQNGCESSSSFTLVEPELLNMSLEAKFYSNQKNISCIGADDGVIVVNATGGVPPYDYLIDDQAVVSVFDRYEESWIFSNLQVNQPSKTFRVSVIDFLGCEVQQEIVLSTPEAPSMDFEILSRTIAGFEIPCKGEMATLEFHARGGDGISPYRLSIDDEIVGFFKMGDSSFVYDLSAGSYQIKVLDDLGCQSTTSLLTLLEPDAEVNVSIETIHPKCLGGSDGQIAVEANGGVPPYEYKIDNSPWRYENTFPGLEAGSYVVHTRDANLCEVSSAEIVPDNPAPLTLELVGKVPPSCHHGTNGLIEVRALNFNAGPDNLIKYFITGGHYGSEVVEYDVVVDPLATEHLMTFNNLWDTKDPDFVATHYEIWVGDDYECQLLANQYLDGNQLELIAPEPIVITPTVESPSCFGGENGWISILVEGGVPPYRFSFEGPEFQSFNTADPSRFEIHNLSSGNFMIQVIDDNFNPDQPTCTSSIDVHIPDGLELNVLEIINHVSCAGGMDGEIDIELSADYQNSNYTLNQDKITLDWVFRDEYISFSSHLEGLAKGSYSLFFQYDQDSTSCTLVKDFIVNGPSEDLSISSIKAFPSTCGYDNSGRAILDYQGGWVDSLTYYSLDDSPWQPVFSSILSLNELEIGKHAVRLSQSNFECIDETTFDIVGSSLNIDTLFTKKPNCSTNEDGQVILSVKNAIQPVYLIADSSYRSSSGVYSGLRADKRYTFIVMDEANDQCAADSISFEFAGCEDDTGELSILDVLLLSPTTCDDSDDGVAKVLTSGGLPPYQYILDGQKVASDDLTDIQFGSHQIVVNDVLGKMDTFQFAMISELELSISSISKTRSTCYGICNGGVILEIEGGSGDYLVEWSDGKFGNHRADLCPGLYEYIIQDQRNDVCQLEGSITIDAYDELSIAITELKPPTCNDKSDGKISIKGIGGSGSFSFEWDNGTKSQVLNNVSSGSYGITVTDNLLHCTYADTIILSDQPQIAVLDTILTLPSCDGAQNGSIRLVLENVISPLVEWDNGQIGLINKNIDSGTHGFSVTTLKGCTLSGVIDLPLREPLAVDILKTDNTCFGLCEGAMELEIKGGLAPYYIKWQDGSRLLKRGGLCSGIYSYEINDRLGCQVFGSVEIGAPDPLIIDLVSKKDISCPGMSDGYLEVYASGGTGSYDFEWENGEKTNKLESLSPGNYSVSVTDGSGCHATTTFQIISPPAIFLKQELVKNPSCDGKADGSIEVLVAGGQAPYKYSWNNGNGTSMNNALVEGTYILEIEDSNGCLFTKKYDLIAPESISIVNVVTRNPACYSDATGSIELNVIGGTVPYSYQWNNEGSSESQENLSSGEYQLIVTDFNECSASGSFNLTSPPEKVVQGIEDFMMICEDGSVVISPDGEWKNYHWEGPNGYIASTDEIVASEGGEYLLSVIDEYRCVFEKHFEIEISRNSLEADFIRISEAVTNEPLVFVDLSIPVPDAVEWVVPVSDQVIINDKNDYSIELVFSEPGTYEIGLVADYQNCISEIFKTVEVEESTTEDFTNARTINEPQVSTNIYPNPTSEELKIIVNSPNTDLITFQLLNMSREIMYEESLIGRSDYLLHWDLGDIPSGMYILVVKAGEDVQQKRVLVVR
ncbi:MAG: T9SS type A sorting domain-containing protein [Bacteroidota bacterium]